MKNVKNKLKENWKKKDKKQRILLTISSFVIAILLVLIPTSFAALEPVNTVTITSERKNYENKEEASWKIDKSAKWIDKGVAEITFDVDTILKTNNKYTDIIFVLDISGSMYGDKLNKVKSDATELINSLLSNNKNRAALITFETNSEIVSELTNNKEELIEKINNLSDRGMTNYYQALVNVDEILKSYTKEQDRECIVLFLTDGYPNEGIPNEKGQYQYLKDAYLFITINGVQYEMGSDILDPIKKVSDHQYIADMETLNNVLFDASVSPVIYDNFEITDYIDTDYFYVESKNDIKVSEGKVTFDQDEQTINWKMDSLKSGQGAKMTIKAKLKDELIGEGGVYPTNKKEIIKSKLEEFEEDIDSPKTPVLADNYKVIYEGNAPEDCEVTGTIPDEERKSVFDTVGISGQKPKCEGYEFKGWKVVTKDVKKINDDYFIMPENDVVLKATWGRVTIEKSMEGTVSIIQTFYKMMADLAVPDDEKSEFVTSNTGIDFANAPSNTNGRGIYTLAETKNDPFPVHYYRGAVTSNNVKFGGFCWKIVRTTSTGGVKMVYNGEPDENGYCNATGTNTQIGTSIFNNSDSSPADVGYMYGNRSDYTEKIQSIPSWFGHIGRIADLQTILLWSYISTGTTYYYGDTITWDGDTNQYILSNSDGSEVGTTEWGSGTYASLKGKYTCQSATSTSCTSVYYITDTISSYIYYKQLSNNQTLEDVNKVWNYGSEIVYENGVYTIQNSTEVQEIDWYTKYPKKENYVCPDGGTTCSNIWYLTSTSNSNMNYIVMQNGETYESLYQEALNKKWIYGNDIEWDGSKYILKDTYESSPLNWNDDYEKIAKRYHYTCMSTENSCTEVRYIHYFSSGLLYYLNLKSGKMIEDAKKEMFTNTTDSKIKQTIDTWYQTNMLDYTDSLEDTIWCNDRSIDRGPLKSKDEDSSIITIGKETYYTYFGADGRTTAPSVVCPNESDQFTVSSENGNGMLTYPVALLTADELTLAGHGYPGFSSSSYLYTGLWNWSLSPRHFSNGAYGFGLYSNGRLEGYSVSYTRGVHPAISLAPASIIASGDGSAENPFTVLTD